MIERSGDSEMKSRKKTSQEEQVCRICRKDLANVKVCCSYRTYFDGTHDNAYCTNCCSECPGISPKESIMYFNNSDDISAWAKKEAERVLWNPQPDGTLLAAIYLDGRMTIAEGFKIYRYYSDEYGFAGVKCVTPREIHLRKNADGAKVDYTYGK